MPPVSAPSATCDSTCSTKFLKNPPAIKYRPVFFSPLRRMMWSRPHPRWRRQVCPGIFSMQPAQRRRDRQGCKKQHADRPRYRTPDGFFPPPNSRWVEGAWICPINPRPILPYGPGMALPRFVRHGRLNENVLPPPIALFPCHSSLNSSPARLFSAIPRPGARRKQKKLKPGEASATGEWSPRENDASQLATFRANRSRP